MPPSSMERSAAVAAARKQAMAEGAQAAEVAMGEAGSARSDAEAVRLRAEREVFVARKQADDARTEAEAE